VHHLQLRLLCILVLLGLLYLLTEDQLVNGLREWEAEGRRERGLN
jgi:hypothetical protein